MKRRSHNTLPPTGRVPQTRRSDRARRGVAAIITLVCLSLAAIVGTLLLQAALTEQRYLERLELQAQGDWLVEAGFSRARAQLGRSPKYSGETWAIPGTAFGRAQNATVRITVRTEGTNASVRHIAVKAEYSQAREPATEAVRDFSVR
jgi:type II secretory pathway component PulK